MLRVPGAVMLVFFLVPFLPAQAPMAAGDPQTGRQLFIGTRELKNGGPPCMACHNAGAIEFLGGGNLGPDLTNSFSSFGPGIAGLLENVSFPVMKPIYDAHPIQPDEAQDIAAYLKGLSGVIVPVDLFYRFLVLSLVVFVVFMLIIWFAWRHRLVGARKRLVSAGLPLNPQR